MSWKIALLVALVTGIITAIVTAPVADSVSGKMGVSDFEGKRGFAVAFLFIPAGFIGGALLGLLGTKLVHAMEWADFWKAAGLSILLGQVGLFSIAGLCLLGLPRPPLIGGKELTLDVEVHVPLSRITPRSREPQQIRMSLYAGPDDNNYLTVDTGTFREQRGMLIVPASGPLNSKAVGRTLSFHIEEHTWLAFDLNALPGSPTEKDFTWSALLPLREARINGGKPAATDVLLRYRVVKAP